MISIIVSSLILCATLYLIARHEAAISLPVIIMITIGASLVGLLLSLINPLFGLAGLLIALPWAIQRFCYVTWPKAVVATLIYLVSNIAINFGTRALASA